MPLNSLYAASLTKPKFRNGASGRAVGLLVKAMGIHARKPCPAHFHAVRTEIHRMMADSRVVDKAAFEEFAELLRRFGKNLEFLTPQVLR